MGINADSVVRVSMFWLIAAYLFHLWVNYVSPVGLSYVSKLVPAAWIGIMFGVYYSSEWGTGGFNGRND
jgi:POT family proton-dependent oligopeptide transporter